jgi:hypothetical protein
MLKRQGGYEMATKKLIFRLFASFLLCLSSIWILDKIVNHYRIDDIYVIIGALPFAIIYLYYCFLIVKKQKLWRQ